jgi:hypothetical protein
MISTERAKRVLADMRCGPVADVSPTRSEAIVAIAIQQARAHGAALAVTVIQRALEAEPAFAAKLLARVQAAIEIDETVSCEPTADDVLEVLRQRDHRQAPERGDGT